MLGIVGVNIGHIRMRQRPLNDRQAILMRQEHVRAHKGSSRIKLSQGNGSVAICNQRPDIGLR